MSDITKDDIVDALRQALSDPHTLEQAIKPAVIAVMVEKFERVLGVDCTNHDDREETRRDMEFARRLRHGTENAVIHVAQVMVYAAIVALVGLAAYGVNDSGVMKKLFKIS